MPKPIKSLTPEQEKFVASVDAAAAASEGRTPDRVLKTFYPKTLEIEGVKISKCGLGILGILEDIKHPFIENAITGKDTAATIKDIRRALYIFAHPREAKSALAVSLAELDKIVEAWVMESEIPASAAVKAPYILVKMIQDGMGMVPGFDPETPAPEESEAAGPLAESAQPTPA